MSLHSLARAFTRLLGKIPQRDKSGNEKGTAMLSEQAILQFAVSHNLGQVKGDKSG
jgi:hypothetical protein